MIARAGSIPASLPVDSGYYVANSAFGSGTQLGSGNYVVYDGMGNTAQITVSNAAVPYYFTVVEYNGNGIMANYLTSAVLQSSAVIMPVEWLSFSGKLDDDDLLDLEWKTATETNSAFFEVMQSIDGIHFESIGSVKAAGNSKTIQYYHFEKEIAASVLNAGDKIYYQLKQWDQDKNYSLSKVLVIETGNHGKVGWPLTITALPNPAGADFRILCNSCSGEASMVLTDVTGKVILQQQIKLKDETTVYFPDYVANGMYFLHIVQRTNQQTIKIIRH